MSEFLKCPECGNGNFEEVALEWTRQGEVKIRKDEGPWYDEAKGIVPEGTPAVEAYYKCEGCGTELYLVDGKLTQEEPEKEFIPVKKAFILVKMYQGLHDGVGLFFNEDKAEKAYKEYTGYPYPTEEEGFQEIPDKFVDSRIFEVKLP